MSIYTAASHERLAPPGADARWRPATPPSRRSAASRGRAALGGEMAFHLVAFSRTLRPPIGFFMEMRARDATVKVMRGASNRRRRYPCRVLRASCCRADRSTGAPPAEAREARGAPLPAPGRRSRAPGHQMEPAVRSPITDWRQEAIGRRPSVAVPYRRDGIGTHLGHRGLARWWLWTGSAGSLTPEYSIYHYHAMV